MEAINGTPPTAPPEIPTEPEPHPPTEPEAQPPPVDTFEEPQATRGALAPEGSQTGAQQYLSPEGSQTGAQQHLLPEDHKPILQGTEPPAPPRPYTEPTPGEQVIRGVNTMFEAPRQAVIDNRPGQALGSLATGAMGVVGGLLQGFGELMGFGEKPPVAETEGTDPTDPVGDPDLDDYGAVNKK